MDIVQGIRKLGFRKWYEHKLVEAHAFLITGFLALILAVAFLELRNDSLATIERAADLLLSLLTLGGGFMAWLRYHRIMVVVEWVAERATCPHCAAYGRFRPTRETGADNDQDDRLSSPAELPQLEVRCRSCGGEWKIDPQH